ncbi:DHH family phosphoesterase, partial [Elusimicrobiota bacterium]
MKSDLRKFNSAIIISHWDCDGIVSAAIITKLLNANNIMRIAYTIPDIGTYKLEPRNMIPDGNITLPDGEYEVIFVLDYSVSRANMIEFQKFVKKPVIVYDHHLRKPIDRPEIDYTNPVAFGDPGIQWPACTWVIKEDLKMEVDDLVVLGIAGDYEYRFKRDSEG